jgi:NAD(P)H-quinone oxidoreductase subunit 5
MTGHALYRLLQFLRAPSILHEFHETTNAAGGHLRPGGAPFERVCPARWRPTIYRMALERGSVDGTLDRLVVRPVMLMARWFDGIERRWCAFCAGLPPVDRRGETAGADTDV